MNREKSLNALSSLLKHDMVPQETITKIYRGLGSNDRELRTVLHSSAKLPDDMFHRIIRSGIRQSIRDVAQNPHLNDGHIEGLSCQEDRIVDHYIKDRLNSLYSES